MYEIEQNVMSTRDCMYGLINKLLLKRKEDRIQSVLDCDELRGAIAHDSTMVRHLIDLFSDNSDRVEDKFDVNFISEVTVQDVYESAERTAESRKYESMKDEYEGHEPSPQQAKEDAMKYQVMDEDDTVEVFNRRDCTSWSVTVGQFLNLMKTRNRRRGSLKTGVSRDAMRVVTNQLKRASIDNLWDYSAKRQKLVEDRVMERQARTFSEKRKLMEYLDDLNDEIDAEAASKKACADVFPMENASALDLFGPEEHMDVEDSKELEDSV